jgi:hypothetical protein
MCGVVEQNRPKHLFDALRVSAALLLQQERHLQYR